MLRVAVLGLGRIGASNVGLAPDAQVNHVGAILDTPGLKLAIALDPDGRACATAHDIWGARLPKPVRALEENAQPVDIVTICGPTGARRAQFSDALRLRPRVIVCEKPLAEDESTAIDLLRMAQERGIPVVVNFNRRFDPSTQAFGQMMTTAPVSIHARYGKGVLNQGSHLVDLLTWWFGPFLYVGALSDRGSAPDPVISFHGRLESGPQVLVEGIRGATYEVFDMEFSFPDRMLQYGEGGSVRRILEPQPSRVYRGLSFLGVKRTDTGPVSGFAELYAAIRDHLLRGAPLTGCSGQQALQGQRVLDAVVLSANNQGQLVNFLKFEEPDS